MSIDIEAILNGMATAAGDVLGEEWPGISSCMQNALKREQYALEMIARLRIEGEIDDDDMREHLKSEKVALEVALRACNVQSKVAAEKAANAAIAVLEGAVKGALVVV